MKRVLLAIPILALALPAYAQEPGRPTSPTPPVPQAVEPAPPAPAPRVAIAGGDWRASKLLGTDVTNVQGETVGEVKDVILDNDGKVVSVLVSVGGFLGLGEKDVAVMFKDLVISRSETGDPLVQTSLSKQALETAPDMATGE